MSRNNPNGRSHQTVVAKRITENERPEDGRVDRVKWNFIYEGDRGLALRLQDEEFNNHFNKNREERWTIRENLKEAKVVQSEEEERLQIERMLEIERMQELARRDEELARKLQEQEQVKPNVTSSINTEKEMQLRTDEMLANRIEEYEKARMRRYREYRRRQLEQEDLAKALSAVQISGAVAEPPESPMPAEEEHFDVDFSDFLSQLPDGLTPEEVKIIQELEDRELAKLLQEAESKRSGARTAAERMKFIRKRAIELRDEQLARVVQQREINRYNERRAKSMTGTCTTGNGAVFEVNQIPPNNSNNPLYQPARPATTAENNYAKVVRQPTSPTENIYLNMAVDRNNAMNRTTSIPTSATRSNSFMVAVSRSSSDKPEMKAIPAPKPTPIQDEYLTPNSLLEASGASGDLITFPEPDEYELPPELNSEPVPVGHHRQRRHKTRGQSSAVDTSSNVLPLPMISPGAPPTATPPAHRLPRETFSSQKVPKSSNNGEQVTNPMFIIERPSKSKSKKDSDCKQQ